jgi:hypothetical protein
MRPAPALAPLLLALAATPALADENQDLDLIPQNIQQAPPPPAVEPVTQDPRQKIYLENAFTLDSQRSPLVPTPPPAVPNWQELIFLDIRKEWALGSDASVAYSGRLNLQAQDEAPVPSHENVRNDFREGYVTWQAVPGNYLDLGRINVKSGVAAGFNPTDFFKTRAVVEPLSIDPAVLREDRLGTFMLEGQHIGEGGSVTLVYAPQLYRPSPIYTDLTLPSFDPVLDRTNAHQRLLLKTSVTLFDDFTPEALLYHEGERTEIGLNLAQSVGQSTTVYAEWAGGPRQSLIADALRYGADTGTLPGNLPPVLPDDTRRYFQNDLAAGASYTTESKIVFNLEYHFHQAGFSPQDWSNWFATGQHPRFPGVTQTLWYIRDYALDQQEPVAMHSAFLRADWQDAFHIVNLELSGFTSVDLQDGSSLWQITADYYLSNYWTIGAIAEANLGGSRSDWGSVPEAASVIVRLARFF